MSSYSFLRYLGSKHRMAPLIGERLRALGGDCLLELFGGTAAVMQCAGFRKRIYNDLDGDLVNLFRVLSDDRQRLSLFRRLRYLPPCRAVYEADQALYEAGRHSFATITDPVDRARATFYRQAFAFGGKMRSGGFTVSTYGRAGIKEIGKYAGSLRRLAQVGAFFRETVVENLEWQRCLDRYGYLRGMVIYADPPYPGIQRYYSCDIGEEEHVFLAFRLRTVPAAVVLTLYDTPLVRELYPEDRWKYETITHAKSSARGSILGMKPHVDELILTRPALPA